ncbi:MAG TPA: DUF5679 domain-containing protein [Thermomicrobiales bacterium]|jgi:hypothetical protein
MMQGYCLKCREKREMNDAKEVTLKNDRPAMQGTCSVCGTKITVIGGKKAAEKIGESDKSDNFSRRGDADDEVRDPKVRAATNKEAKAEAAQYEAEGRDPVTAKIKAETKNKAKAAKK